MVDRAKVIKGLECCAIDGGCGACPYDSFKDCPGSHPTPETLMKDALALLKEQEQKCRECGEATSNAIQELQAKLKAQEPIRPRIGILHNEDGSKIYFLHCPFDGTLLDEGDNYCRKCGREVKWK